MIAKVRRVAMTFFVASVLACYGPGCGSDDDDDSGTPSTTTPSPPPSSPPPPPPSGAPLKLDSATMVGFIGEPFRREFVFSGGAGLLVVTFHSRSVPQQPNMSENVDFGTSSIVFSGTPTIPGQYTFSATVSDSTGSAATATFSFQAIPKSALFGTWQFAITVTSANGRCSSTGPSPPVAIQFGPPSSSVNDFDATGFLGAPSNRLRGSAISDGRVRLIGCYFEDRGVNFTRHVLSLTSPTELSGDETWEWHDIRALPSNCDFVHGSRTPECPNGKATVSATK